MKQIGIYKIRNVVNGNFYVGSSNDIKHRFAAHRRMLRGSRHHCAHLQAAWNKYGEECFIFEVVACLLDAADLFTAENGWLQANVGKSHCYNAGISAEAPMRGRTGSASPNFGMHVTDAQKEAISTKLKAFYAADPRNHPRFGKHHTPEALAKISANRTPPAGAAHYRYGQTVSAEVREKIGAAQRGVKKAPRVITPEGRAKIAAAAAAGHYASFTGKTHTAETKEKMSRAILATLPDRTQRRFVSLTEMRDTLGVSIASVIRGCKGGKPVKCGACVGWVLSYADEAQNASPAIPEEYAALPRTRSEAKALGAPKYFTGIPCEHGHVAPRKTKGVCIVCAKIEGEKSNERKRVAQPKVK